MNPETLVKMIRNNQFAEVILHLRSLHPLDAAHTVLVMIEWMDTPSEIARFRRQLEQFSR